MKPTPVFCGSWPAALALLALLACATPGQASEALSAKAGCVACHAVDKKLLGPSYKEIAAKYKGDKNALATLTKSVRQGSKGVWGPLPMAATPVDKISDADLKALLGWVLKAGG